MAREYCKVPIQAIDMLEYELYNCSSIYNYIKTLLKHNTV